MLIDYLSTGESIKMTVPVSTMRTPKQANIEEREMCFYLPEAHQANPPQPTEPEVYLVNRPEITVYTR